MSTPIIDTRTPREEWPDRYRRVVEYFEATEDVDSFESGGRYPDDAEPYVLHTKHRAPMHEDDDRDRPWNILLNPWSSPSSRTAWITDGQPLRHEETAVGAPEDGIVANDRDLEEVHSHRLVVCVALTKVASMHSRGETWIHGDERIEAQFDRVLDALEDGGRDE
ncbi:hypothetical protein [Halopiger xanaduensis]|uniref:Uncharacterized protein n=1 Tax=Halopiger xanaduensis (strain DSM 18323 / JCM 14033 / SH-6) TaxID=797210 RepID=F8DEN2_HALXS|nr:hypothetical protein [Halopiger xanaduensis]AEH39469.1 hypothetical protein Halxa_0229 [Halopiger xanaduensis SH-6]